MITVENVAKNFARKWDPLYENVSFEVPPGQFVAITGTSGLGKSTLLNLIGGLDRPSKGVTKVKGVDIGALSASKRAQFLNSYVGFIFQSHHLLPELTAIANVMLPLRIKGEPHSKARSRANDLLTDLGLADDIEKRPGELSGGMQQRVAIARALANQPEVLLADEPTGSVDKRWKEEVFGALLQMSRAENVTVLMVTHDLGLLYDKAKELRVDRRIDISEFSTRQLDPDTDQSREISNVS